MTACPRRTAARPQRPDLADRAAEPEPDARMATIGFAVNFWAWALLGPLGATLLDSSA